MYFCIVNLSKYRLLDLIITFVLCVGINRPRFYHDTSIYEQALDKVQHGRLILKLRGLGIRKPLIGVSKSFLGVESRK